MFIAAKLNISLPTHFRKIAYKPQHRPYKPAGPDLQYMLRQSCDYLTIMPELRSTYDRRLIYKTSHEGRKAFLRYDSLAKL